MANNNEPRRPLFRVDFPRGGGLNPSPIRNVPRDQAEFHAQGSPGATIREDGMLTTIREFVGEAIAKEAAARGVDIDELVCATSHGPEGRVLIGRGYSIVCFVWQPLEPRMNRTRCWPAYLAVTPEGLRVLQSA